MLYFNVFLILLSIIVDLYLKRFIIKDRRKYFLLKKKAYEKKCVLKKMNINPMMIGYLVNLER